MNREWTALKQQLEILHTSKMPKLQQMAEALRKHKRRAEQAHADPQVDSKKWDDFLNQCPDDAQSLKRIMVDLRKTASINEFKYQSLEKNHHALSHLLNQVSKELETMKANG